MIRLPSLPARMVGFGQRLHNRGSMLASSSWQTARTFSATAQEQEASEQINRLKARILRRRREFLPPGEAAEEADAAPEASAAAPYEPTPKRSTGEITHIQQEILTVDGLASARLGSLVSVQGTDGVTVEGLVISMVEDSVSVAVLSDPYGGAVRMGNVVVDEGRMVEVPTGPELGGRVVDALCRPTDGHPPPAGTMVHPLRQQVPGIVKRAPLHRTLPSGIMHWDFLHPLAAGLRVGVFGPRQSGKTDMMIEMVCNQVAANKDRTPEEAVHCIYVCVGKTEYQISKVVGMLTKAGAMSSTTVVRASQSETVAMQVLAPFTGSALASQLRDAGKHALVIYDDFTRHGQVYSSLPTGSMGFSHVSNLHAWLLEQAAQMSMKMGGGSATCLVAVETEGEDVSHEGIITSYLDDVALLDANMAANKEWPPLNCRKFLGRPPTRFQPLLLRDVRNTLNDMLRQSETTANHYQWARDFGLEPEDVDYNVMAYRDRLQVMLAQSKQVTTTAGELYVSLQAASMGALSFFEDPVSVRTGLMQCIKEDHQGVDAQLSLLQWHEIPPADLTNSLKEIIADYVNNNKDIVVDEYDE